MPLESQRELDVEASDVFTLKMADNNWPVSEAEALTQLP